MFYGINIKAVTYNIEIKSKPEGDYIYHPTPDKFASLMYDLLREKNITKRVIIQSFDIRPLQVMHYIDPTVKTSLLLEGDFNLKNELQRLGFKPNYVSPDFTTVNAAMVKYLHSLGIRIIPWTVNELEDIYKMEALGVDGIISDFPNRALPSFINKTLDKSKNASEINQRRFLLVVRLILRSTH